MAGHIRRRDFLALLGGGLVGTVLSPLPWKLIDDVAIWTQNWEWLPRVPRGPRQIGHSHCALCRAGCGLRVRSVGDTPFQLSGVPGHPAGGGALCALALGALQLPFHPARLHGPVRRVRSEGTPRYAVLSHEEAIAQVRSWIASAQDAGQADRIAVLDGQDGRVISTRYRAWLTSVGGGRLLTAPDEAAPWATLAAMLGEPGRRIGCEWEQVETILSFGAPLLEDGGHPAWAARWVGGPRRRTLIQIETRPSTTARMAGRWLRIRPGSEAALALGLAHVILTERLVDEKALHAIGGFAGISGAGSGYRDLVAELTPERVARQTGLEAAVIREVARQAATCGPTVALAGIDPAAGPLGPPTEVAVWGLNLLLSRGGVPAGLAMPRPLPLDEAGDEEALLSSIDAPLHANRPRTALPLAEVSDASLRLLILDPAVGRAGVPWPLIARKMMPGQGRIVAFSPFLAGHAARADMILPTPAPFESLEEVHAAPAGTRASFAVSRPLLSAHPAARTPGRILADLAPRSACEPPEVAALQARAAAIHARGWGEVFTPEGPARPLAEIATAERFWEMLMEGTHWRDTRSDAIDAGRLTFFPTDATRPDALRAAARADEASAARGSGTTLMPFGSRGAVGDAVVPPMMSKLYRESTLRPRGHTVLLAPATAQRLGVRDGDEAVLETDDGTLRVRVAVDAEALPDLVHVAAGPTDEGFGDASATHSGRRPEEGPRSVLDLCRIKADGTWRATPARLRRV